MSQRNPQTQSDIYAIIDACTGAATVLDELTLIRVSIRAYFEGRTPEDAVAWASEQLSNSLTKR